MQHRKKSGHKQWTCQFWCSLKMAIELHVAELVAAHQYPAWGHFTVWGFFSALLVPHKKRSRYWSCCWVVTLLQPYPALLVQLSIPGYFLHAPKTVLSDAPKFFVMAHMDVLYCDFFIELFFLPISCCWEFQSWTARGSKFTLQCS